MGPCSRTRSETRTRATRRSTNRAGWRCPRFAAGAPDSASTSPGRTGWRWRPSTAASPSSPGFTRRREPSPRLAWCARTRGPTPTGTETTNPRRPRPSAPRGSRTGRRRAPRRRHPWLARRRRQSSPRRRCLSPRRRGTTAPRRSSPSAAMHPPRSRYDRTRTPPPLRRPGLIERGAARRPPPRRSRASSPISHPCWATRGTNRWISTRRFYSL
mmetsp:Transcript_12601/g.53185  ORF Transcript_12601/g.53185 Transcript_12601/m.53185 type:complete len:214 (-) Transcript_12601:1386-2027(-)